MSSAEYPDLEWFRDSENWARWSGLLNMRFTAKLAKMVASGADMGRAVNDLIVIEAHELVEQGVPNDIVGDFICQYMDNRAMLMEGASIWVDSFSHKRPSKSD